MLEKFINFMKDCCKETKKGNKKRKIVYIIGIVLITIRAFFGLFYKVGEWYYFSFEGKYPELKTFLLVLGGGAILAWAIIALASCWGVL